MKPQPVPAASVPPNTVKSNLPASFAARFEGRTKRKLGDFFGLVNYGVNLTELAPGALSSLPHHHALQDEFIYIVQGTPTLVLDQQEYLLQPGDCMGLKAGSGVAHQLINRTTEPVRYLEVGDRTVGDQVTYLDDDLRAVQMAGGVWVFSHKDGRTY